MLSSRLDFELIWFILTATLLKSLTEMLRIFLSRLTDNDEPLLIFFYYRNQVSLTVF